MTCHVWIFISMVWVEVIWEMVTKDQDGFNIILHNFTPPCILHHISVDFREFLIFLVNCWQTLIFRLEKGKFYYELNID